MNSICLGREPSSYALTYGGAPRHQQIAVATEQIHLADYILNCGKQRLVIQTPVKVACVESGKLLWERPITRRSTTTICPVPGKSRFTLNMNGEWSIVKCKTGKSVETLAEPINDQFQPLFRKNEMLVLVERGHRQPKALCCFDEEMRKKWEYKLETVEAVPFLDLRGETLVIYEKKALLLDIDGNPIHEFVPFSDQIDMAFKADDQHIFLKADKKCCVIDVKTYAIRAFSIQENLEGYPIPLVHDGVWSGFVCAVSSENIGIFDTEGKCLKKISNEWQVKDLLVDAKQNILVITGIHRDCIEKAKQSSHLEEQLRYRVDLYDATGKELKKFRLEHGPVISPFTITEEGDLAYFFNGNLITCTIP